MARLLLAVKRKKKKRWRVVGVIRDGGKHMGGLLV
jgi:hypothetical protein